MRVARAASRRPRSKTPKQMLFSRELVAPKERIMKGHESVRLLEPRRVARALLQRFRLEHGRCAAQRSPPAIHGGIAPRALSFRPRFEREPPSLPCTVGRRWNESLGPMPAEKKRKTTLLAHLNPRSATPCHPYTTVNDIHARMDGRHALFVVERSASLMLVLSREAGGPGSQARSSTHTFAKFDKFCANSVLCAARPLRRQASWAS